MSFDDRFKHTPVPVETRAAEWYEYLPGMAKMLGLFATGLVLDAVLEGLTGTKTNFASMAQLGGTAWYMFGPGAPERKQIDTRSETKQPAQQPSPWR